MNKKGYGPPRLLYTSKNKNAVRGQEHRLIEANRKKGRAADQINGVGPRNKNRAKYIKVAEKEFGKLP